jgi:hypothetical protein
MLLAFFAITSILRNVFLSGQVVQRFLFLFFQLFFVSVFNDTFVMKEDPPEPDDDDLSDMLDGAPTTSPHLPEDDS